MKSIYKRFTMCGTGGINCRCCINRGFKPTAKRIAKRRMERKLNKEVVLLIVGGE